MYFNIKDSYLESNSQTSTGVMKQAYLNGQLLWEEDIADGGDGWEYVRVPLSSYLSALHTDGTPNVIFFRIHIGNTAVDANVVRGVKVWVDDVYLKKFDSPTGDNLIRDGSVELIIPDDLPTGAELDAPWFRNDLDNFSCSGQSRPGAVYISSTDRKSGSQAILLEMPDISNICQSYPNNVIVSAGTIIDFTELLSCSEYSTLGFTAFPCTTCTTLLNLSGKYFIDDDITISDDITLSGSQVKVANGISITVSAGGHLTIQNDSNENSHLFPCDEMWTGIVVEPGGQLTITGNKDNGSKRGTLIEGAQTAVSCDACTLKVRYSEFNRNMQAMDIRNNIYSTSYIYGTTFRCEDWLIGRQPFMDHFPIVHLSLDNVTNFLFPIGDPTMGNGKINYFSEAFSGISTSNSKIDLKRNRFNNIYNKGRLYNSVFDGTAISIENSFNSSNLEAIIGGTGANEDNQFINTNIGIKVLDRGSNCEVVISGNEFDNSEFKDVFTSHYTNTALTIQSNRGINHGIKRITENVINNFRLGIHAINIPGIEIGGWNGTSSEGNTIGFDLSESPLTSHYTGIWLQSCTGAKVVKNEISNSQFKPDSRFRGIDIESSPDCHINCNEINNAGIALNFYANCNVSKIRANHFSNYEIGIMLNNAIIDTEQGTPGSAWDNLWFPGNLSDDKVSGLVLTGGQINWYHQDADDPLNDFSPNPWNGNIVFPIPNQNSGGVTCDDFSRSAVNRLSNFGAIVGDSAFYTNDSIETRYQSRLELYLAMLRDSTIIFQNDSLDTDFEAFYNSLDTGNVGRFTRVIELIASNTDSAEVLLTQVSTSGENESLLKSFYTLYLDKILTVDTLSSADSTDLTNLTQLSRTAYGAMVHDAAVLLFFEIHPPENNLRVREQNTHPEVHLQSKQVDNSILIFPNPADHKVTFVSPKLDLVVIEILNVYGSLLFRIQCNSNVQHADLSKLPSGIYYSKSLLINGNFSISKFVLQR